MTRTTLLLFSLLALLSCSKAGATQTDTTSNPSADTAVSVAPEVQAPAPFPLTLAFAGDIMMGTTYPDSGSFLPARDGADLFKDATPILEAADIAAANLEGTLLDGQGIVKKCGNPALCYAFRMPTRYVNHLVNAGFDFVGIANNHINDFGSPGLASTQATLKESPIAFAGLRGSCPTAIIERDGRKIGLAAFGHNKGTLNIMNMEEVRSTVGKLRGECDFVIVSFHGGGEGKGFTHVPHAMETCFGEQRGNVEAFAHAAIDAGADVVYGHGPHVTRALELYKDRLIMYSLGNFCTPYRVSLSGINGHAPIVTVTLNPDGTFQEGKIHSLIQTQGVGPRLDATGSVARHMRTLSQQDFPSSPLKISDDGSLSK